MKQDHRCESTILKTKESDSGDGKRSEFEGAITLTVAPFDSHVKGPKMKASARSAPTL